MTRKITRRGFLATGSGVALAGLAGVRPGHGDDDSSVGPRSRVVLIRAEEVLDDDGQVVGEVVHDMLNRAVTALTGADDARAAWRELVSPEDVVGVKSNVWGNLPTPPALEEAIRSEVVAAGVTADNVAVDDRGVRGNPVFARATALINVRPMRTHHWSGLGTCLKNVIMFVPRPADYHGDTCASLGAIWKLPQLAGKVRLNILVMLTPQFHSVGPHGFSKTYVWPYRGLIVGTDPVAVDATGARIIAARRREYFGEERPIAPSPHHIQVAEAQYGLGVADPARIDLVRLGWEEEALI